MRKERLWVTTKHDESKGGGWKGIGLFVGFVTMI
jgi:hypothetical protein